MVLLYAGEQAHATREVGVKLDFACSGCTFASKAFAIGRGSGTAHNPFFLETGAAERAADESFFAAHRSAREAMRLVRCPRCGERDPSGVRRFWVVAFLKTFAMGLVVAFAGGILFLQTGSWIFFGVGVPAAAIAIFLFDIVPRWRTVEARVLFDPPRLKHRRPREPTAGAAFDLHGE